MVQTMATDSSRAMPAAKRRRACEQCRQQKIRCDTEPPNVCSRCRRMGLRCAASPNPRARQTKAQLREENEQLRLRAELIDSWMERNSVTEAPVSVQGQPHELLRPPSVAESALIVSPMASHANSCTSGDERCAARALAGQIIESKKIRGCFSLFFRDYLPSIPIFDPQLSPDHYYESSQFLFWAMVFVGSRRYSEDPTLLGRLRCRMNAMALLALESRESPIETIKGILLLCMWPIPMNTMHKDISHVLSGAAVHLGMQIGLHITGSGQDFARGRLNRSQVQKIDRAHLWMYCLMVLHSTSIREGLSPFLMVDPNAVGLSDDSLDSDFPLETRVRRNMYAAVVAASSAIVRTLSTAPSAPRADSLGPLIAMCDSRLLALERMAMKQTDAVNLLCCRLHILSFYFLQNPASPNQEGLLQLYTLCCKLTNDINNLNQHPQLVDICTVFIERAVMLAAICILKIHRSELAPFIDLDAGERAYFSAIQFCKQASLENDDLGARAFTILSQLWTSRNVFQRSNGRIDSLSTRIRTRLSMSIVFDCFWWWREEFTGQTSPYRDESRGTSRRPTPPPDIPQLDLQQPSSNLLDQTEDMTEETYLFSAKPFPDYDWAASIELREFDALLMDQVIGSS